MLKVLTNVCILNVMCVGDVIVIIVRDVCVVILGVIGLGLCEFVHSCEQSEYITCKFKLKIF